jgi:predicted phosphodiesterase
MSSHARLNRAYQTAKRIAFDDRSKIILFSDCHRGDNSFADEFANNRNIYYHALNHYFDNNFTYCELGDGDELWENKSFKSIFRAHKNIYLLLAKFYSASRLNMIWGNHDMVYKNANYVAKHLATYRDPQTDNDLPLFPKLVYHEGIILQHSKTKKEIFLTHGHQADWWNYLCWKWSRFLVRILWKPIQIIGIADPTSPAKNHRELIKVERRIKDWITKNNNIMTIIGHTHRPRFPKTSELPLFNDGSCVHPRSITGIELVEGKISLIKWHTATKKDGTLQIVKTVLEGPNKIIDYLT